MKINYKLTTLILAIALVFTYTTFGTKIFPPKTHNHDAMDHMTHENTGHTMDSMMMDMTERMKGKTGDELDKIFLEDMIVHHQGAVDMAVLLQQNTKRPELQEMAQNIITAQTKEITMMQNWLAEWFTK